MTRWLIVIVLMIPGATKAAVFAWDPVPTATAYQLHYGQTPSTYDTTLDTGAATSAVINGLSVGATYYFAATASNALGTSAYSNEVAWTVPEPSPSDTTPPTVQITSPTDGATVPRKATVSIDVQASDDVGVTGVKVQVNGTWLCTETTSPYRCQWLTPPTPNRRYTIQAMAYDAAGHAATQMIQVTT